MFNKLLFLQEMFNKNLNKNMKDDKGQILVISLLIILILSIIVLSTVVNLRRDVQERVNNELYEQNYSYSESKILQTLEFFDEFTIEAEDLSFDTDDLNSLEDKLEENFNTGEVSSASCDIDSDATDAYSDAYLCDLQEGVVKGAMSLAFTNRIKDLEMSNNDVLQINLQSSAGDYRGPISMSWEGSVVWSIGLVYRRNYTDGYQYEIVKDRYAGAGFQNFNTTSNLCFSDTLGNTSNSLAITLASNNETKYATAGAVELVALRLRPIITGGSSTRITFCGNSDLPKQFLDIKSQSYQEDLSGESPTPLLAVKKPLNPAPPAIFDYVYYSNR